MTSGHLISFPKQALKAVFVKKDLNFTITAFAAGIGVQNQKAAVYYWRKLSITSILEYTKVFAESDETKP